MPAALPLTHLCAIRAVEAGRRIRSAVQAMPPAQRGRTATALLKPGAPWTLEVDRAAEEVGVACLEQLAAELGRRIHLITDPATGRTMALGTAAHREVIFAHLDAVDGSIKVGGLGSDPAGGALRLANDGNWGVALAFTAPTDRAPDALTFGDFVAAAVVDGNPLRYRAHPEEVAAVPHDRGLAAYDLSDMPAVGASLQRAPRVFTSTATSLAQAIVYFDAFQAFDLDTRRPGDERLAGEIYRRLIDRHQGGAFDVTRQYGNLSALLHTLLGWRGPKPWIESQGAGFVVVNENLANLIAAVPIVEAAGGVCVDFDGRRLRERRLVDGRCSVVHAANDAVRDALLRLIAAATTALD